MQFVKKRLLSLITAAALMVGMLPAAFAGYENFTSKTTYPAGQFTDVPSTEWYAQNVQAAYEYKLVDGVNATQFKPNSNLTIAQAIKLAACLHSTYVSGTTDFETARPWYQPYVTYALENGIINTTYADYDQPATRAQFASIFANALPEDALTAINDIADGAIADVDMSAGYAADVYRLYRAGVLTGSNNAHDFKPNTNIRRSEVAAIVTRMAKPDLRQSFTVEVHIGMTADEVFSACVPAIFKLYAYDYKNNILGIGSGVVLSARGDAVTCGHLVNGVYRLVAEMYDGTKREVTIYSFDADADIAHIRVVGSTLPYLGVTTEVEEGDTVYALGYPGGGAATVTTGKVTDPENDDYLAPMIESTAQVISGNSGGALINDEGKVVGITVSSHSGGVPSYSVPIRYLNSLIGDGTAYSPGEYNRNHKPDASRCYSKHYPVPDFGTVTGVTLLGTIREGTTTTYYYDREEVEAGDKILLRYYAALGENTFYQFTGGSFTSSSTYPYSVKLYETSYDGIPAISVVVSSNSFASIGGLLRPSIFFCRNLCITPNEMKADGHETYLRPKCYKNREKREKIK